LTLSGSFNDVAALENNPNPFAIVVLAHLKTLETRHAPRERFEWNIACHHGAVRAGIQKTGCDTSFSVHRLDYDPSQ
jgi:hypothetical protein